MQIEIDNFRERPFPIGKLRLTGSAAYTDDQQRKEA